MSWIMRLLGEAVTLPARSPDEERWWWSGAAQTSVAGVRVDADTALKISTFWACVMLLSETIASLPLVVYRYVGEDDRERARNNPLYFVLHDRPNQWQTAAEFREMMTGHVLVRGNSYAQIVPGPRGPVDQLVPIHPDRIPPGNIEKLPNGRLRYWVRQDDGTRTAFNQEDIFHLRGPSRDGITGLDVITYAANSLGLTLAAEHYGSRFFANDASPGGVLRTDKNLKPDGAKRLKASWEAAHRAGNQHRVAVLEDGLQWQQVGISPEQAQMLGTREFQAEDVCRWLRVPPHMVGLTSKATSWGSGIEQMSIGFVTYTLMPWLTRWTQAISRDLIIAPESYFAEFVVAGLLRGDITARYNAYGVGRQWGFLSANDIRRLENMNRIPNGDRYLEPANMDEAGAPGPPGGGREAGAHYHLLAEEAAGRVVRKEIAAMSRAAQRAGDDRAAWEAAVADFYDNHNHIFYVAQTMRISILEAELYIALGRNELMSGGPDVMKDWNIRRVADLVRLATSDIDDWGRDDA